MSQPASDFTPALGPRGSIKLYDHLIALLTREKTWRSELLVALTLQEALTIVDIGAGTASMAIAIKSTHIRIIAEAKAKKAGTEVEFITAMGDTKLDDTILPGTVDRVLISLVLHQCPLTMKMSILANAFRFLKPGGRLLIADYGRQRSMFMKVAFNLVRLTDGYEDTRANKNGRLPEFMSRAGFMNVEERSVTPTPTGSISIYTAMKPTE